MKYASRWYNLSCSDYSDGLNTVLKASDVGARCRGKYPVRQCVNSLDLFLHNNKRRPAVKSLASLSGRIHGLGTYLRFSGNDTLFAAIGNKLKTIGKVDGSEVEIYDWGSSSETWFSTWSDILFVANGIKTIKVEGSTAYPCGITAPSGVAAAGVAGGSLPDGIYKIYAGYARRVDGSNVLYSKGQSISDITLGSGNNSIQFSVFPNSTDSQVGNKVVWMTDAGGSTYYLYYQTGDNTTTTFSISDDTGKLSSIVYSSSAIHNDVAPAFEFIHAHDRRIWGSVQNVLYFSLQEGNRYDLERFNITSNFITYPHNVEGIFSIGADLYVNTLGGIIRQPNADPIARYEFVGSSTGRPLYFKYFRTLGSWSGAVIGLTNDGVRIFDGQRWTGDLTKDIRPEIDRIYSGYSTKKIPCGAVYRSDTRMEYHLCYNDPKVTAGMNNRRLILNLDRVSFSQDLEGGAAVAKAPWDRHRTGANYLVVDSAETMFSGQANDVTSIVYKERTDRMVDEGVYIGDSITTSVPAFVVRSGTFVPDMMGFVRLIQTRVLAQFVKSFSVRYQIVSRVTAATLVDFDPNASGSFILDVSRLGVDRLVSRVPELAKAGLPRNIKGPAFYVEFTQAEEDKDFELLELTVNGTVVKTRKT